MTLKYTIKEVFKGRLPIPSKLFELLEDMDNQITEGVTPKLVVKKNVKLTPKDLKKAFGDSFDSIGIVHNSEGSYLIIANGRTFKHISLENI